jgi:hypothetical protein
MATLCGNPYHHRHGKVHRVCSDVSREESNGKECFLDQLVRTSYAQYADWCYMLVRADTAAPKHRGISYLMADMKSPGITVKPLRQMHGGRISTRFFSKTYACRAKT